MSVAILCAATLADNTHTYAPLNTPLGTRVFIGLFSENLALKPYLDTRDSDGTSTRVFLTIPDQWALKALALRGRFVKSEITLTEKLGSRAYQGNVNSLSLETPKIGDE